jgi:anaerobic magnesium-protoporphyrin IX monomethyl ester cyclase
METNNNNDIDLIFIEKAQPIDYKGYSDLPLDRIDIFRDLVQLRMIYLDGGFRSSMDLFNKILYGKYYQESSYQDRRKMLNVWNLPSLNSSLALAPLIRAKFKCKIIRNLDSEFDLISEYAIKMKEPIIAISTTFILNWSIVGKMIKKIKSAVKGAQFIVGGAFINDMVNTKGKESLEKPMRKYGINFGLFSFNSELDFLHTIQAIKTRDFSQVDNLAYFNQQNKFCINQDVWCKPQLAIDKIPFWEKSEFPEKCKMVQLRTSSGCSFSCSFCTYPISASGHHSGDLKGLRLQLDMLKRMKKQSLFFIDDTPNVPPKRFKEILNILGDYNFRWYSFLRVQYLDEETAKLMKTSGCDGVYLGLESANIQVLKNMNKSATPFQYQKGIDLLKKHELVSLAAFIIGFPGETAQSIQDNIDFISNSGIDYYSLKEFWYSHRAPIHKSRHNFGLEGVGNEWQHQSMSSKEASQIKLEIFSAIERPTYIDSDASLWSLAYLRSAGLDWHSINQAHSIINRMMKRDNCNKYNQKKDLVDELETVIMGKTQNTGDSYHVR